MFCHLEVGYGDLLDGRYELHYSPSRGDDETEKRGAGQLNDQAQEQPLVRFAISDQRKRKIEGVRRK